ncbi:MAG: undecaprenyl-diphosphate phosphatase [Pirellulales bacterium]|nr:undecaprenyl-diphosphate phosphatase [Pirellulales bacterium]
MDLGFTILLGIVQGITEFLPISSDGHLAILNALFRQYSQRTLPDSITMTIALHVGTLASVFVVYWNRIWRLLYEDRRVLALMVVGTVPAVVLGLPLRHYGKEFLESPLAAGCFLPVTGLVLLWSSRFPSGPTLYPNISFKQALVIGLFQATAILPGISRSGTTITAGLMMGLSRESSATFSFLLVIPAIVGAAVLEIAELALGGATVSDSPGTLALGALVSFVVGVAALTLLLRLLNRGRFAQFAWWCIPVGMLAVIWQLSLR